MKYEIEIEGLPEGWEPVAFRAPTDTDDGWIARTGEILEKKRGYFTNEPRLILRRTTKKYDWSKTLDDVLVRGTGMQFFQLCAAKHKQFDIPVIWQPNIHGKCPVDPEASIVLVMDLDGDTYEDIAGAIDWSVENAYCWQFVRLADGVEW